MALGRRFRGGFPNSSALSWDLAHELAQLSGRAELWAPDLAWAYSLRDDLCIFAPELEVQVLGPLETDLIRNRGPSIHRRAERIKFLTAWFNARPGSPDALFIFTPEGFAQSTPHASFWTQNTLHIRKGQERDRTELSERLAQLGYLVAELVEAPTEFAVRGSIVDVFPPTTENPIRIELFGDEVQSIRSFHADSQRRLDELDEVFIPPCREFAFPPANKLDALRSRLRLLLDELDWAKADRDALLTRFQQQSFFPTIDYWAPLVLPELFGPVHETWAKATPSSLVVALDPHALEPELRTGYREMERNFTAARADGEWVPRFEQFVRPLDETLAFLHSKMRADPGLWLSLRPMTGLAAEPAEKFSSSIRTHDILADRLNSDRALDVELPLKALNDEIRAWNESQSAVVLASSSLSQLERLNFLLGPYGLNFKNYPSLNEALEAKAPLVGLVQCPIEGFYDPERGVAILLDEQIFGTKRKRVQSARMPQSRKSAAQAFSGDLALLDLKPQDLVVHKEHGIGRYLGLRTLNFGGVPSELFEIEYKDGSKLLVPVTRLNTIQKYGGPDRDAALDKLGGQSWDAKKSRAKKELRSIAGELLHLYSLREMARGPEIRPSERIVDEFAATFPYVETPDQAAAINDTLKDMRGPKPMDRLVCGDVGYGKTEVALRAAHAAVAAGYQVAVLVPTTILAAQHESTFKKRLAPLGFSIEGLSRFRSNKEARDIAARLKSGELKVVIGTHRLLGQEIGFQKLGLLIIDEEQRFGVVHKEKIKKLRNNVHVLSLSATPIPRTLNMAISGLKDLSIISTPPQDRMSVRTHVARKKSALTQEAIENELRRGGQVFYVHNRVQTIEKELAELRKIVPNETRIEYVHGQMDEHILEERMLSFYEGRTQVLLTTSIIESGLDVPNANTLIVDRADTFGLAQLYQIRGRVGRSSQRAYAYFLLPEQGNITQDAEDRLAVLESYQELGSGFHVASHDMEIRGTGDLLGREQSGQIAMLGFDAYVQLLQECVAELRGEQLEQKVDPEINLGIDTVIPDGYIPETGLRLSFYRKLAASENEEEIESIQREIEDRFGDLPESVKNLILTMRIRVQLRRLGVRGLNVGKGGYSVAFDASTPVNPSRMVKAVQKYPAHFQMNPDGRLLIKRVPEASTPEKIMRGIEVALSEVESWIG
jgi:transcription-repair coupling factor (superfamily II helicase)